MHGADISLSVQQKCQILPDATLCTAVAEQPLSCSQLSHLLPRISIARCSALTPLLCAPCACCLALRLQFTTSASDVRTYGVCFGSTQDWSKFGQPGTPGGSIMLQAHHILQLIESLMVIRSCIMNCRAASFKEEVPLCIKGVPRLCLKDMQSCVAATIVSEH